jgi:putative methionine-R-sulfoxide reductase with GAF domain
MKRVDESIARVLDAIRSVYPLRRILRIVLDESLAITEAEEGGILISNPRTGDLSLEEWVGNDVQHRDRLIPVYSQHSVCAEVAKTAKPVFVDDTAISDPFYALSSSPIRSEVAVPLLFGKSCMGVINAESTRIRLFTIEHQQELEHFADVISPYVQARISVERDQRWSDAIIALRSVNQAIGCGHRFVLREILTQALALCNAIIGGILLYESDSDTLKITLAESLSPQHIGSTSVR